MAGTESSGIRLDEMETREGFMVSQKPETVTLLPDPPQAPRHFPVISAAAPLIEPAGMFEGRIPAKFADLAPRIVVGDDGSESWLYDGQVNPNIGLARGPGR